MRGFHPESFLDPFHRISHLLYLSRSESTRWVTSPSQIQKAFSQPYGIRLSLRRPNGNLVLKPMELRLDALRQQFRSPFVRERVFQKAHSAFWSWQRAGYAGRGLTLSSRG